MRCVAVLRRLRVYVVLQAGVESVGEVNGVRVVKVFDNRESAESFVQETKKSLFPTSSSSGELSTMSNEPFFIIEKTLNGSVFSII